MKTALFAAATVCALSIIKWTLGDGVAMTVAVAALSFCIGAAWGAGEMKSRPND